ncbi:MAG: hypothetical protein VCA35_11505 [Roseibacillus sp.]
MTAKTQLILSLLPVLAAGVLLSACVTQTTDQEHFLETSRIAPEPNAGMAGRSGESLERIGMGYWVFQRKCLECHEARVPVVHSNPGWHPVLDGMSWNAGLSSPEQGAVLAYLRAACR